MGFKRSLAPSGILSAQGLTSAMVGIGMAFADHPLPDQNIEDILLAASIEGIDHEDLRVLAVLMSWLAIHASWINADRLTLIVTQQAGPKVQAFWSSVALWLGKDRRFARLAKVYQGPHLDLLGTGTAYHLLRSGEDPRLKGGPLRVPAGLLRMRKSDVMSPTDLAQQHGAYHYRIMMGPTYRADMWAALDKDPTITTADLARRTYGSFSTAWQVKHDWRLLSGKVMTRADPSFRKP
jgi:hypothetical protein